MGEATVLGLNLAERTLWRPAEQRNRLGDSALPPTALSSTALQTKHRSHQPRLFVSVGARRCSSARLHDGGEDREESRGRTYTR